MLIGVNFFKYKNNIQSKAFFQALVCIFLGILMLSRFSKLYVYIFKALDIKKIQALDIYLYVV